MSNGPTIRLVASFIVGVLVGYYVLDIIGFSISPVRRVTFNVVNGKVDRDSVRVNRFFPVTEIAKDAKPPYTKESLPAYSSDGAVFGFPFDGPLGDPYRCVYTVNGLPMYKDFPSPPVPPCPQ